MGAVSGILGWLGWAGIIAGLASLASAVMKTFTVSYAGISLPHTLPGAIGILAAGIVLAVLGGMLRRKSGCSCCCGGDHSESVPICRYRRGGGCPPPRPFSRA